MNVTFETLKTVLNGLLVKIGGKADKKDIVQPDMAQNDPKKLDYVKNRTHYDTRTTEKINITFDGVLDGKEYIVMDDAEDFKAYLVKISDLTPSIEEMVGGIYSISENGNIVESLEITEDNVWDEGVARGVANFEIYPEDLQAEEFVITKGTYTYMEYVLAEESRFYGSGLSYTKENGELKQLDKKFIPEDAFEPIDAVLEEYGNWLSTHDNNVTWLTNALNAKKECLFVTRASGMANWFLPSHSASEIAKHVEAGGTAVLLLDTKVYSLVGYSSESASFQYLQKNNGVIYVWQCVVKDKTTNCGNVMVGMMPCYSGYVFNAVAGQILRISEVYDDGSPKKIEAVDPWVIASSTADSTKKFKITVDDSGTLTATEVTE